MKKIFSLTLLLVFILNVNTFSVTKKKSSSNKKSSSTVQAEPVKVLMKFLQGYIKSNNIDQYVGNSTLVTDNFKIKYFREVANADELDGGGLDYIPIVGGQDTPTGYKLVSYNSSTGIVIVTPKEWDSKLKFKVKKINGKWFVDNYYN